MALKIEKGFHPSFFLNDVEYYIKRNRYGFGYEIVTITKMDKRKYYKLYFRSVDKELVKKVFHEIAETEALPKSLPDTSNEVGETKVFRHETKHHTYYYRVNSLEELEKVGRHILKSGMEYDYWNPTGGTPPENETGMTEEEINALPDGKIKENALKQYKRYKTDLTYHNNQISEWEKLGKVVNGEGDLHDVMERLDHFEIENWELLELTVVT